jgi:hypothetical protein
MPPRDHQAVARRHRVGIGDAQRQLVLQQHPAAGLQRAEHASRLAPGVAGLQAAEVGGVGVALAGVAAEAEGLQVAEFACAAVAFRHDVVHLQGPLVLVGPAALAAVAAPVGEHLFAALLSEGIESLAALLLHC